MFKLKDFKVRNSYDYPPFQEVIQSWYSPLLGNKSKEDGGYSTCLTIGVSKNEKTGKNDCILASLMKSIIPNTVEFISHVKCLSEDYLNKSLECVGSIRTPTVIVMETNRGVNPILSQIKVNNLFRFYPEFHGGDCLDNRIGVVSPFLDRFFLTHDRRTRKFRPDDLELLHHVIAYPSEESYSIVSAFVQGILYAKYNLLFEDENKVFSKENKFSPEHVFY